MSKSITGSKATDQAIAGFTGGAVSTLALHPLDLIKTKLQVDERNKINKLRLIPDILKQSGLRGLYRGIGPNFVGATSSWGLYFFWYTHLKDYMAEDGNPLSAQQHLAASALGGLCTTVFTNPIWVVKTRMFTQQVDNYAYKGLYDGLRRIFANEGIRGYYKGIVPAMFGVSHGALQFMAYEQMKLERAKKGLSATMKGLEYLGMAALSKLFATVCTYPYQVVKSRMQTESRLLSSQYNTVAGTITTIFKNERIRGFYKGMGINMFRVLPGTVITFGVYEVMTALTQKYGK